DSRCATRLPAHYRGRNQDRAGGPVGAPLTGEGSQALNRLEALSKASGASRAFVFSSVCGIRSRFDVRYGTRLGNGGFASSAGRSHRPRCFGPERAASFHLVPSVEVTVARNVPALRRPRRGRGP